jgi:hypothetical protein
MQSAKLFRVWIAVLYALPGFAAGLADAQSKSAATEIIVYESPT